MKILIATETYVPTVNGVAYFSHNLAVLLANKNHEVYVIHPSTTSKETLVTKGNLTEFGLSSIRIPLYPKLRIAQPAFAKKSIRDFIAKVKPDIIHIQNHFIIGRYTLEIAKKLNIPIVGTNHVTAENFISYLDWFKPAKAGVNKIIYKQFADVYNELDQVTAPTETTARLTEKFGIKKRVIAISCGVDLKRFNPTNSGIAIREKYKIPDKPILLYVGRLDKEKRIETILESIPRIKKDIDVQLVIAGTGKNREDLEAQVAKMGIGKSVTFTGFVPDAELPNFYRIADIFVIAGIAETQSIVTMEALASGLPIVAANAMALPELVHDGENGYLFPADNDEILAEKVIKILSDKELKDAMGRKSLEIIQAHDINKTIERFEALYKDVIAKHAKL